VKDEADIRGHRKTYVGAFPGRIITGLKNVKSCNPVMMLDEIDKLASDHRGDPSSALLEVLDPEQNKNFVDHYLGVEFDLSDIMFIANANTLDTIPGPLRDRLEVIEVSGYSEDEKVIIANQYLIPKQVKEAGLEYANINFSRTSVTTIINNYTRESGLRGLEKKIASVCRKIAREVAEAGDDHKQDIMNLKLTPKSIKKHLGADRFGDDFYHKTSSVGVSLGLAYTSYGGEVMAIETNLIPAESHRLVLTGKLGDVMKESAQAALSYIRSKADVFGIDPAVLSKNEMHIHVPAGAVPKDGPSAGIAMATSILSGLLKIAPKEKTAMTGEITIHGKVLAIGGLKEKLLAAAREGMECVILPDKNRAVYEELPPSIKKNLTIKFVKDYEEVFEVMFGGKNSKLFVPRVMSAHDTDLAS
jgi:ATP-dependent Lon protease